MIKVLHIDDDQDHHELTKAQLQKFSDDLVLDRADSGKTASEALKDHVYDCLLTDDQVPGNAGVELLKSLRRDGNLMPCVILSEVQSGDNNHAFREKAIFSDEFHVLVDFFHFDLLNYWIHRLVDAHRQFLQSDRLKKDLFMGPPEEIRELRRALKTLTKRETEILNLIGAGKSNMEIAQELFISYKTVKNHVYNLFAKLGIHTRAEAIHYAIGAKITDER